MSKHTVEYPVFVDPRGNRFVFPGLFKCDIDGRTIDWARCRTICMALNVSEEPERFVVPVEEDGTMKFEHVVADAISSGFQHGGSKVYLIGGPDFEAIAKEVAA